MKGVSRKGLRPPKPVAEINGLTCWKLGGCSGRVGSGRVGTLLLLTHTLSSPSKPERISFSAACSAYSANVFCVVEYTRSEAKDHARNPMVLLNTLDVDRIHAPAEYTRAYSATCFCLQESVFSINAADRIHAQICRLHSLPGRLLSSVTEYIPRELYSANYETAAEYVPQGKNC